MLRFAMFGAQALFLWMFFATQSLETLADANLLGGDAYTFAAEWRHGVSGAWPIYMPGFFACGITTWLWCIGRPLRKLIPELLLITTLAIAFAFLLTPWGGRLAIRDFSREYGVSCDAVAPYPAPNGIMIGVYSVLAWNAFILSCHRAMWWWSFWPLLVPVVLDLVLYFIRPYTFDDHLATWFSRASAGDVKAVFSYVLIPVAAFLLAVVQLARQRGTRVGCFLFGHRVDNRELRSSGSVATCRCGSPYLDSEGRISRVRHTLTCFFGGHHYRLAGARDAHNEYVCIRCGHPLLVAADIDREHRGGVFRKFVHYRCGLLGHKVHKVADRDGCVEYACYCGHSFLRPHPRAEKIRHPLRCVFLGHFVSFIGRRFGFAEFVCRNCGHPFSFSR